MSAPLGQTEFENIAQQFSMTMFCRDRGRTEFEKPSGFEGDACPLGQAELEKTRSVFEGDLRPSHTPIQQNQSPSAPRIAATVARKEYFLYHSSQ
jgi:hypothetical protein